LYPADFSLFVWASKLAAAGTSGLAALAAGVDTAGGALESGVADTTGVALETGVADTTGGEGGGGSAASACESAPAHKETNKSFSFSIAPVCHEEAVQVNGKTSAIGPETGFDPPIKKPGLKPGFQVPMPLAAPFSEALDDDWSFLFVSGPIASEQHFSLAPSPKLALLQRSVKINVAQKQQHLLPVRADPRVLVSLTASKSTSRRIKNRGQAHKIDGTARGGAHSTRLF
jgi:hypothetical protein